MAFDLMKTVIGAAAFNRIWNEPKMLSWACVHDRHGKSRPWVGSKRDKVRRCVGAWVLLRSSLVCFWQK